MGITDDIEDALDLLHKKSGDRRKFTSLFIDLSTAKDASLSPTEWARLSRFDKKILRGMRTMELYRDHLSPGAIKSRHQAKKAALDAMKPNMPKTQQRRKR